MGLTKSSVGVGAVDSGLEIKKLFETDKIIALAGNPNVGKSTVFNALTGLNQHTGNWPGKTVSNAQGYCRTKKRGYVLVDIPGTYSLMAHSAEEEVARNFICFGGPDAVVVVCDATSLERNLNLVLQTVEISKNVIVCVNLMDEAKKRGIEINLQRLSALLGVPVVGTAARNKKTLLKLTDTLDNITEEKRGGFRVRYPEPVERATAALMPEVEKLSRGKLDSRWLSLKLLDRDPSLLKEIGVYLGADFLKSPALFAAMEKAEKILENSGITQSALKDITVSALISAAENIAAQTVEYKKEKYCARDRKLDKILTGKLTAFPVMAALLAVVFWLTMAGANYPSELLSSFFSCLEGKLLYLLTYIGVPEVIKNAFIFGIWRVTATVVSVMLPPMAIFFPFFTLLEDSGYLPRIAYNLDRPFKCCNACGKQALTVCMGFGCNAAGVVGCRIIDSPRERLLAILTNNFVPCNGRFPMLISVITMFFIGAAGGGSSFLAAIFLTAAIILSIGVSMLLTRLLSKTVLKGLPSSYTLELPPYRRPQIGRVIVRSVFDRTLFVLGRAAAVAAPAGLIIWLAANINVNGASILSICAAALEPIGKIMGLDGAILLAFILGFPANETVIPIIIMTYAASGTLEGAGSLAETLSLFVSNGWSVRTAVCFIIFTLMHWPCSTTLLTVKKETGSLKWTALAFLLPTAAGALLCVAVNLFFGLFGL